MHMAFDRVFVGKNALSCFSQDVTEDPRLPHDAQIRDFCDVYANLFLETIKTLEFLEASQRLKFAKDRYFQSSSMNEVPETVCLDVAEMMYQEGLRELMPLNPRLVAQVGQKLFELKQPSYSRSSNRSHIMDKFMVGVELGTEFNHTEKYEWIYFQLRDQEGDIYAEGSVLKQEIAVNLVVANGKY